MGSVPTYLSPEIQINLRTSLHTSVIGLIILGFVIVPMSVYKTKPPTLLCMCGGRLVVGGMGHVEGHMIMFVCLCVVHNRLQLCNV